MVMKITTIYKELDGDDGAVRFTESELNEEDISLQENEILIKVAACAVGAQDKQLLTELFIKNPKLRISSSSSVSGVVLRVGSAVTSCNIDDRVTGVISLDSDYSGCATCCVLGEFDVVKLPDEVDFVCAAACLYDGIKAYTALHYLAHVSNGESVLITDSGLGFGYLATQLALSWGAKVFAVVSSSQERNNLEILQPAPDHVLEMDSSMSTLCSSILEETGRLGVDVVVDNGVRQFTSDADRSIAMEDTCGRSIPSKQSIISCLAVGGRWVTCHPQLQLDPPNSLQLFLRCASISFLFEQSWNMSSARQGKWLHIAKDVIRRLAEGSLHPNISEVIPFHKALDFLNSSQSSLCQKNVVVQMF